MENAGKILVSSSAVIMFAAWVIASYKTGFFIRHNLTKKGSTKI